MAFRILYADPQWRSLQTRLDALIDGPHFAQNKQTDRTRAGMVCVDGRAAFVKQVKTRGYLHGLLVGLTGSRGRRALRGAALLAADKFCHPRPLLVGEARRWGAVRATYVVTEALRAPRVLSEATLGRRYTPAFRKEASRQVAAEIRRLHDAGIYTRDMQETNLMVERAGERFVLYFVDLEDFRAVGRVSWRRRLTNLVHLDRSIGRFVSRARRLRFLYNYLGARPSRSEARRIVRDYLAIRARVERRWATRNLTRA
jgi:tRNA A-37 threonylcarbamoyl transferase component Bud32